MKYLVDTVSGVAELPCSGHDAWVGVSGRRDAKPSVRAGAAKLAQLLLGRRERYCLVSSADSADAVYSDFGHTTRGQERAGLFDLVISLTDLNDPNSNL